MAPTKMLQSGLQPTSVLLSQLDDTQSGTALTVTYYALAILVIIALFRLRYPCLTLSGLRDFVDMLDVMIRTLIEGADLRGSVDRLQRQIVNIEHEQATVNFRWSSVYGYIRVSLITVRNIVKCYDQAQELRIAIMEAIAHRRRALDDFEDNYRRNLNSERNRRQSSTHHSKILGFRDDEETNDMV
ncbi:hypothetical protein K435DRAFT_810952 [Dendrothele bispora CBS 962.96]|uniref:Uncharacterized protein n=1 Tax=Dendrothele bispora (strain CBS 962.96) TaxID=1314807 RepID=A0A4S8KTW2_DENBC|nr:hypothetical protein K435DRAFT_810952 [Dendrothele bispora CBS 962.96]